MINQNIISPLIRFKDIFLYRRDPSYSIHTLSMPLVCFIYTPSIYPHQVVLPRPVNCLIQVVSPQTNYYGDFEYLAIRTL